MQEHVPVVCPECQLKFKVPIHVLGKRARCNNCQTIFVLEAPAGMLEDTVAEWLLDGQPAAGKTAVPAESAPAPQVSAAAGPPADLVRLERIDDMGAYFEFPSDQLPSVALRSSFPRKCVACGANQDLQVHLLLWTDRLPPKDQLRRQEAQAQTFGPLSQYESQTVEEFLGRLPTIKMLPAPYDLPFPYFICPNCSSVGEVLTHVLSHGAREYCQVMIANLEVAADFLANNGGARSEDYQLVLEAWQQQKGDPWRALPLAVRNRLRHWYQKQPSERFVEYFPDLEFSRAELGVAGMVLTNHRAIFKKFSALREFDMNKPTNLRFMSGADRCQVELSQTGVKPAMLTLSPSMGERFVQRCRSMWPGVHVAQQAADMPAMQAK